MAKAVGPVRWQSSPMAPHDPRTNGKSLADLIDETPIEEDDESFLSKHGGKVAMVAFTVSMVLLFRYFRSNSKRSEVEEDLADLAVLEPYEIHDLRVSNDLTAAQYDVICDKMFDAFPQGECTYTEFVAAVRGMVEGKFHKKLKHMHLLDRLVTGMSFVPGTGHDAHDAHDCERRYPLRRLLVAFNTAINAPAAERITSLDRLLKRSVDRPSNLHVTTPEVEALLEDLARTWQIPHEKRTAEDKDKLYPVQGWRVNTAPEMVKKFRGNHTKELAGMEDPDRFDLPTLEMMLKSGSVCVWGECYGRAR